MSDKRDERAREPFVSTITRQARAVNYEQLSAGTIERAKHCLLDWFGVTIRGARYPAVDILRSTVLEAEGESSIVGSEKGGTLLAAALVNGTAGHVLDFDDGFSQIRLHPTVPVAPALLSLAERRSSSGKQVMESFVAGLDVESRVGLALGPSHYESGWHSTGTLGTFGAAAACARLLELEQDQWQHALGIAATQAAGLRAVFGTMSKALHAGKAAESGLLAAELARRGYTANPAAIEVDGGFASATSSAFAPEAAEAFPAGEHGVDNVHFKRYASCAGTHSAIEAIRHLRQQHEIPTEEVEKVVVRLPPLLINVCAIEDPRTTLEAKFSVAFTVAAALGGSALAEDDFAEELVRGRHWSALARKVIVEPRLDWSDKLDVSTSPVEVSLRDGTTLDACISAGQRVHDDELGDQWDTLKAKFQGLVVPVCGRAVADQIVALVAQLEELSDVRILVGLLRA